ncbi:MAG: ATPase, T2SS/T4P/T4SS family [Elusimicrobiales bacterium]|nr:ATPase, T2SS/T4P/T4SS family [Elusimicrobiales bacterium]
MDIATSGQGQGRILAFAGPKEGVGKSTVVLNLALAWAGIQRRNVLIVPLDPLVRGEHTAALGLNPPSVADLVRALGAQSLTIAGGLLKGKIPVSQWGVGVLPIAHKRADVQKISPRVLLPMIAKLSQTFDIFLDVESSFPMQTFAFDIADMVVWVTQPSRNNLNATVSMFQDYRDMHFPLDRFEVVCNSYDLPGSIEPEEVEKFFNQLNKKVLVFLPWEESIPLLANQVKIEVVEQPQSLWVKGLRMLLGRVLNLQTIDKNWASAVSDEDFQQAASALWSAKGGFEGGGPAPSSIGSALQASAAPTLAGKADLPPFWEELKQRIHGEVVKSLEVEHVRLSDNAGANPETRAKVSRIADQLLSKQPNLQLSRDQRQRFVNELLDEILGYGPLEELLRDPSITEIMVNAPDRVFTERAGKLILTKVRFRDEEQVVQVIKRIVAPLGKRIDESVPLVDARLQDGSRVNAIIRPLAVSGPTLTIRRFSQKPFGPEDYYRFGTINRECMEFLKACVLLRKNIIVSGGTGTGKTTFLNALSSYIPEDERIISVEDTAELKLQQVHWVRLESRPPNVEGKGEVTIRDLVKNCLRMRPDRIVVGECRGAEALDMLQAMNTGHEGSLTTIHANTPRDALTRLEAMCLMAGADLPIWALREMICSAVHMVVQLSRFADGTRKVTYVTEVTGREENQILTHDIYRFVQTGVDERGKVVGKFTATGEPPKFYPEFATKGMHVPVEAFWTEQQKKARGK